MIRADGRGERRPRVFLTGAAGFIGAHVAARLERGGFGLRVLVHRTEPEGLAAEVVRGSLERISELGPALAGCDAVVHAAALLDPIDDAAAAERINHRATVELAERAAAAGVSAFVFVSSMAALGYHPGAGLLGSESACRPTTAYGKSKLAAERGLEAIGTMRVAVFRPPTVYGPGERRNFLALVRAIDTGLFPVPGSGKNRMSFCWVGNLADAIAWSLETDAARGILHVADEPVSTFRESVFVIARALDRRALRLPFPLPAARVVARASELVFNRLGRPAPLTRARLVTLTADCALDTRGTAALGFRPATRFADGVAATIDEYRRAGVLRARR